MLSSDKNIETLTQLIEMLKHNIELRTEYVKLDTAAKVARLISVATLAAVLLLRAMNPEFLAVDEITASEDVAAMEQTAYCGTYLLATAHAANLAELSSRPLYARLLELGVFSRAAVLSPDKAYRLEALV